MTDGDNVQVVRDREREIERESVCVLVVEWVGECAQEGKVRKDRARSKAEGKSGAAVHTVTFVMTDCR
jgi:hypothetical protein